MTHRLRVYPLGHAVEFESGEAGAIEAARESWDAWPQLFDSPALRFRLDHIDGAAPAGEPRFSVCGGAIHFECDAQNQGSFSLQTRTGWMRVSRAMLGDLNRFRYSWLEALVLTALDTAFFTPVHAACVGRTPGSAADPSVGLSGTRTSHAGQGARPTSGLLLCGDSGAGKTTLAFAAARAGWTLVSDDGVHLAPDAAITAVGGAHTFRLREPARALFPELESRPASIASNGKMAIAADAGSLGICTAWSTNVAHSVFLARRPGPAKLSALPVDQGVPYFMEWVRNPDRSAAEIRAREVLARGCWRLEYDEFSDALPLLEQLP